MPLFDVYTRYPINPVKASGHLLYDDQGKEYLDYYGGHAVISIGHAHPHFRYRLKEQIDRLPYYSNAVQNPLQEELAAKLALQSGLEDYQLFMCNSGAEANENALKLASFRTGRSKVLAFTNGFHGRTSAALAATDMPKAQSPLNMQQQVDFLPFNATELVVSALASEQYCAVIFECIQGVGGLDQPTTAFLGALEKATRQYGTWLIADEVQSGFGRSGCFFAFQAHGIKPDVISMAKGMGNGFPVGGILVDPQHRAVSGELGTTFGGNHMACAAVLAVLEVLEKENPLSKIPALEKEFRKEAALLDQVKVKGKGLMLGLEFQKASGQLRKDLISHGILTGGSKNPNLLRVLPPYSLSTTDWAPLFSALKHFQKEQE